MMNKEEREAVQELLEATGMIAARIGLSITAKRMQGKDESADLEEKTFLVPWEKAAEKVKALLDKDKPEQSAPYVIPNHAGKR